MQACLEEQADASYVRLFGQRHMALIRTHVRSEGGTTMCEPHDQHPTCAGCHKRAEEIPEYIEMGHDFGITPEEFVITEEGTYNPVTKHFWCTWCYIKAGQPLGKAP